ncbi:MAG TPA: hypothetical protein VJV78_38430 [Polyangiales bacterium]|nr:hypothetical protein [Polyangiales bacterium]
MRCTVGVILVSLLLLAAGCYQTGGSEESALAGSGAPAPTAHACPAACSLGLHLQLHAVQPFTRYENARLEVCHNDSCIDRRVEATFNTTFLIRHIYDGRLPDGMEVAISLRDEGSLKMIDLRLNGLDATKLRDGDRYLLRVTSSDGENLHDYNSVAHYKFDAVGCSGCPFEDATFPPAPPVVPVGSAVEGRGRD